MSFQGLDQILQVLRQQPEWEAYRQYCQLGEIWQKTVTVSVSLQTRPLYISRRVLWVATSSSVWAQHLTLQRCELLKKLHPLLTEPVDDLRFSTAHWAKAEKSVQSADFSTHPSYIGDLPSREIDEQSKDGFLAWLEQVRWQSHHLPLCPQCQAPTPRGELERWQVCAFCTGKHPS